ncbi:MAG: ABC transporter ATP-binding protein [Actinomycetota bacterium]|nr:ABC transporter ATP-binding protein [Actinomycetota bacterium]
MELNGLTKRFGTITALDGIDLTIPQGETVALLGPNGAGKTTMIAILLGLLDPTSGSARVFGSTPSRATRAGLVGVMLQDAELMAGIKVGELVRFVRGIYPSPADLATLIETAGIGELLRRRTDRLSGGQAQRVRFALAAAGDPRLLVLDEPTAAMDVQARQAFWTGLIDHTKRGTTVVFSTHNLEEADKHANRVVLIRSGRIVADGTPEQVKAAAGGGRIVRFRLVRGSPEQLGELPGATAVHADERGVTVQTTDADATIWALYPVRDSIADIEVIEGTLEEAFLSLTSAPGAP